MLVYFQWESVGFHYPPERGIEPEQTLQLLNKDQREVFGWQKK